MAIYPLLPRGIPDNAITPPFWPSLVKLALVWRPILARDVREGMIVEFGGIPGYPADVFRCHPVTNGCLFISYGWGDEDCAILPGTTQLIALGVE